MRIRYFSAIVGLLILLSTGFCPASYSQVRNYAVKEDSLTTNGVQLFYRTAGNGPPLLLLHGLGLTGNFWDTFLPDFAQRYTVIMPDLRGHGRSTNPSGQYRHSDIARDVFGMLDKLDISRFKAIGHSSGGMTLYHMATQQPDRIEAMITIGIGHRVLPSSFKSWQDYPQFEKLPEKLRTYFLSVHPGGEAQIRNVLKYLRAFGDKPSDMTFTLEDLSKIKARTLVIFGDRDGHPVDIAVEAYKAIPKAALWVVPNQGHFPFWPSWGGSAEAAKIFPTTAIEFLDSVKKE